MAFICASQESCLDTVENSEHTRGIYIHKDMNECNDQTTCISLYCN